MIINGLTGPFAPEKWTIHRNYSNVNYISNIDTTKLYSYHPTIKHNYLRPQAYASFSIRMPASGTIKFISLITYYMNSFIQPEFRINNVKVSQLFNTPIFRLPSNYLSGQYIGRKSISTSLTFNFSKDDLITFYVTHPSAFWSDYYNNREYYQGINLVIYQFQFIFPTKFDPSLSNFSIPSKIFQQQGEIVSIIAPSTQSNGIISYTSSNPSVADISNNTLIIINKPGTSQITATQNETELYAAGNIVTTFVVEKDTIPFTKISNSFTKDVEDVPFNIGISTNSEFSNLLTFYSSNENIATVDLNGIVTIHSFGQVTITGSIPETELYKLSETSVVVNIRRAITISQSQTMNDREITLKTSSQYNANLSGIIRYTPQSFSNLTKTKYLKYTGFRGVLNKLTVNSDSDETDFSADPWIIELSLPNVHSSDYNKVFKLYKVVNNELLIDANYPRDVTYDSGIQKWVSTLPTFSDFVVIDETPPDGILGGDPYLLNLKTRKSKMISNSKKEISIYESEQFSVVGKLERINKDKLKEMNLIRKNKEMKFSEIDYLYLRFKYITELQIIDKVNNGKLKLDCYDGSIIEDNGKINHESINTKKGLSNTMCVDTYYPKRNLRSYSVYLDNGNILVLKVDNYWTELNNIKIYNQ